MASKTIIGSFVMLWVLTRFGIRGRPQSKIHHRGPHPLERGVHLFGLIRDLRVALAAMNDLDAELVGQVVEFLRLGVVRNLLRLSAAELLVRQGLPSDV